ncbi:MAG: RapZ C-terminal domain-containing protein [Candidatus Dormibacteria bacterium]
MDHSIRARPRTALVFGPPGSQLEAVVGELEAGGCLVDSWDGTESRSPEELQERAAGGEWDLLVRVEADAGSCLSRLADSGRAGSLSAGMAMLHESRRLQHGLRIRSRVVLDASHLSAELLRARVRGLLAAGLGQGLEPILVLESFAYPKGVPLDLDWCVDARSLRNPYWEEQLRPLSGLDPRVLGFVMGQPVAGLLVVGVERVVLEQRPAWIAQGRQVVRLGIGCTGGFHRSVAIVAELGSRLPEHGLRIVCWHREIPD